MLNPPGYLPIATLEVFSHVVISSSQRASKQENVVEVRAEAHPSPFRPTLGNLEKRNPLR